MDQLLKARPQYRLKTIALAVLSVSALFLTACSDAGSPESAPEEKPTEENVVIEPSETIRLGTTSKLGTTNPLEQTWSSYVFSAFDGLLGIAVDENLVPGLAESWDVPADDELVFNVRDGAKFHDGTTVTGEDVVYSINLVKDNGYGFIQNLDTFDSVTATGNQVTVKLSTPDPLGLHKIGQIPVIPKAYWEEKGEEGFVSEPIGTGPFKVTGYDPGVKVELERFEDFWGEPARTKFAELLFYTDAQALESAFESGQIEVAHALPSESVPLLESNEKFVVESGYFGGTIMMQINTTIAPFDDPNLRRAANLAIDQTALVNALDYGSSVVEPGQVTFPGVLGYRDDIKEVKQDLEEAKKLVEASSYDGTEIKIVGMTARTTLFEAITASLKDAGFNASFEALDVPVWLTQFRGGSDAHIFQRGVSYQSINDAARAYRWFTWSEKPFVTDPAWLKLWSDINQEMDVEKRTELLLEATQMVHDENYVLFTSSTPSVNATVLGVDGIVWLNPAMDFRNVQWVPAS